MAKRRLIPHWSNQAKTSYSTINARLEPVAAKPAYRAPFKYRRRLIPADGFWLVNGHGIPRHIRMRDGDICLAGLRDSRKVEREGLQTCSIIVMPAYEVMKLLHEHMPAIIAPAH